MRFDAPWRLQAALEATKADSEELQLQADVQIRALQCQEAELGASVDRLKTETQALSQQLSGSQVGTCTVGIRVTGVLVLRG